MKKFLSFFLTVILFLSSLTLLTYAKESDIVVLYTNDVHCAIDDYDVLAAYRAKLISEGDSVITVDAGDAIQGEVIGSLTEGAAVIDIMNSVGYDYAVPGNHEFDYGMEVFLELAENTAEFKYISSDFYNLKESSPVFSPYSIEDFGDFQVGFVGISTPETISSSTPDFFMDENGKYVYGFPSNPDNFKNEILYKNIQKSVDDAIADGADYVIAVGHSGILGSKEGLKSTDIIANTYGIDCFIDAHSHETITREVYKNKNKEEVFLTSTGAKFSNFGVMTIRENDVSFELVNPDDVNIKSLPEEAKSVYNTVKKKIDDYNADIAYLSEEIGTSESKLIIHNSEKDRIVRLQETNLGDFVADAYRSVTGADIAIANGGGIRAEVEQGSVSRKTLMDVNAFNNNMCVVEVTGQQIVDLLEHGARKCPEENGGFFQVSGITFEIHTYRETPVVTDSIDNFVEIDETKERRVQNVRVNGKEIELDKIYTLAGSSYVLLEKGDGVTLLDGIKVVKHEELPCDSEMLLQYFTEVLDGKITDEKYGNPDGEGRIKIIDSEAVASCEHICHRDNWFMEIIWSMTNFINKTFNASQICDCGEAHY